MRVDEKREEERIRGEGTYLQLLQKGQWKMFLFDSNTMHSKQA